MNVNPKAVRSSPLMLLLNSQGVPLRGLAYKMSVPADVLQVDGDLLELCLAVDGLELDLLARGVRVEAVDF